RPSARRSRPGFRRARKPRLPSSRPRQATQGGIMKWKLTAAAACALALAGAAAADTTGEQLTLYPVGHGQSSHAQWLAQEGRPDSQGDANQALLLEAAGTPNTSAAGIVRGFAGVRIRDLLGLSYEHRVGG